MNRKKQKASRTLNINNQKKKIMEPCEGPNRKICRKKPSHNRCYNCNTNLDQQQRYFLVRYQDGVLLQRDSTHTGYSVNKNKMWKEVNNGNLHTSVMTRFPSVEEQSNGKLEEFYLWQRKEGSWETCNKDVGKDNVCILRRCWLTQGGKAIKETAKDRKSQAS